MIECAVFWFQSCSRVFLPIAILVSVLWLIETRVKILQPHHRAWMWRLFFVKCLVATLLPWFVVVPWLPSMPSGHALVELRTEQQHGIVQVDDSFDIHSMGPVAASASAVESDFKRLTEPASQQREKLESWSWAVGHPGAVHCVGCAGCGPVIDAACQLFAIDCGAETWKGHRRP